MIYFCS